MVADGFLLFSHLLGDVGQSRIVLRDQVLEKTSGWKCLMGCKDAVGLKVVTITHTDTNMFYIQCFYGFDVVCSPKVSCIRIGSPSPSMISILSIVIIFY